MINDPFKNLREACAAWSAKFSKGEALDILQKMRIAQLKEYSVKELTDELRRRGKTVSKKGVK